MHRWKCSHCGEALEAPESLAGQAIACASCGSSQPVGGAPPARLREAVAERRSAALSGTEQHLAAARLTLELERVTIRPHLRLAVRETAYGLLALIVATLGTSCLVAVATLLPDRLAGSGLLVAYVVSVLAWVLSLAWSVGGVVRFLLAASRMI